ncbi:aminotransferase class III-fold pyridoxal phosphate-dependent enzyme [Corynebacterium sp. AOP40-9SA-29]|uniref:aminotransferase class III-fold pyridoxal phosphate-dependent enzyme n=1 Tax=Corynebacterium sp. AOP40-9SA-29 TaxID=3457677 RepID=UPI0040348B63
MPQPQSPHGSEIYARELDHVFHSWSAQDSLDPLVVTDAEGPFLVDADGTRYIDFSSQLVYTNLGHRHPAIVQAIKDQADALCTVAPAHANEQRARAAEKILGHLPDTLSKVFFTNGGADAVEHALRMAKLHTGRPRVLSAMRSYHGGTQATLTVSGDARRWPIEDGRTGVVHFFGPFLHHSVFRARDEAEECERALEHLEDVVRFEGPETFAALIIESVPGTAGIMPPPPGYLAGAREICDRHGILLICDEVMAGFGRTGAWFAFDHYGVAPDLVTFAKGVNSGYVPLGGVAMTQAVADTFATRPYPGGLTYSGHPLATAAAVAAITAMEDEGTVDNAARLGRDIIGPALKAMQQRHPVVADVRGLGCFWAVEFTGGAEGTDGADGAAVVQKTVAASCRAQGLIVFVAGSDRIHVVPPLNIPDDVLQDGLDVLDSVLAGVQAAVGSAESVSA